MRFVDNAFSCLHKTCVYELFFITLKLYFIYAEKKVLMLNVNCNISQLNYYLYFFCKASDKWYKCPWQCPTMTSLHIWFAPIKKTTTNKQLLCVALWHKVRKRIFSNMVKLKEPMESKGTSYPGVVKVESHLWTLSWASRSASWQRWSSASMFCFSFDSCWSCTWRARVTGSGACCRWAIRGGSKGLSEMPSAGNDKGWVKWSWELRREVGGGCLLYWVNNSVFVCLSLSQFW